MVVNKFLTSIHIWRSDVEWLIALLACLPCTVLLKGAHFARKLACDRQKLLLIVVILKQGNSESEQLCF